MSTETTLSATNLHAEPKAPWYAPLIDKGRIPDALLRRAITVRLGKMLKRMRDADIETLHERHRVFVRGLLESPIAIRTDKANEQHYEVPPEFFKLSLGPRLKYSCGYWPDGVTTLEKAEEAALALVCARTEIKDGQKILELGCGWGSLSLYMAEKFPGCEITAVSNSGPQRVFIESAAKARGFENLRVVTDDMNDFRDAESAYDRCVSVEMFEHMKNYDALLQRISGWLKPEGKLFVHIFTHRELSYHFEEDNNWIGKYFFTGGTMPGDRLLFEFQRSMRIAEHWRLSGTHYEKTANAWLENTDANRGRILELFAQTYGEGQAEMWLNRWRTFYIACAQFWGFAGGGEWLVSHYLFENGKG